MAIRLAFAVPLVMAAMLLYVPAVNSILRHRSTLTWLLVGFVGSRIAGWLAGYVLGGGMAQSSDLVLYYYPEAERAVQGAVPYRDFASSYGPLFPYIAGFALPYWNDRAATAMVMVAFEIAAVLLFSRAFQARGDDGRELMTRALFVYLINPAALYWSGVMAYNSSTVLFFWVVAAALLVHGRYTGSLVAVGGSVLAGKFLGVLVGPVWLAHPRRRYLAILLLGTAAAVFGVWARDAGVDLLLPLQREGQRSTAGNVWFLTSGVLPVTGEEVFWRVGPLVALAGGIGGLAIWLAGKWKQTPSPEQVCAAVAATGWLFMILSKKSYPHYTPMFLLFSIFSLSSARRASPLWAVLITVLGAIGILEPGFWNALSQPQFLWQVLTRQCGVSCYSLVFSDVALVAIGAYFVVLSVRAAVAPSPWPESRGTAADVELPTSPDA